MKKSRILNTVLCAVILIAVSGGMMSAQSPRDGSPANAAINRERPAEMTAEELAKRKTDLLQKELNLSDRQYKKVYKLYKKQAAKELSSLRSQQRGNESGMPGGGRMGGGRGPGGGMGMSGSGGGMPGGGMQGGMGMSGGGGRPPAGGMPRDGDDATMRSGRPDGASGMRAAEPYTESDKDVAAREKKMKKILSAEQYAQWSEWDRNERRMRARRMWQQEMDRSGESDNQRTPERVRN